MGERMCNSGVSKYKCAIQGYRSTNKGILRSIHSLPLFSLFSNYTETQPPFLVPGKNKLFLHVLMQLGFGRMVRVSILNDALKSIYIGEFEYIDDHRAGKIVVELNWRLNKCGVINPRFDVGVKDIEGWTARLLPSR
ncbi:hypothetical protein J1N35_014083 [Gossypium stocksii]|uniref:30S ribosomal protein S8, chloroplastic n=1 Tax=Gossypium stocksii TaxID=47602 RepID=A0A9D4A9K8_9ROSI|nr:hypothetical protein J1N35_014083 [Gossypium stocksii]